MEHEVFAHSNGEMFYAWDVQFADLEQRRESGPCTYHEKGNRPRKGKMCFTLETANVSFSAAEGCGQVGLQGMLSSPGDQFYDVTISSIEPKQGYVRVFGRAAKKSGFEKDR